MSNRERVFHAVLFELLAIVLTIGLMAMLTEYSPVSLSELIVLISLIAMVWNFLFNKLFDHFFQGPRLSRGFRLRLFHTFCFEFGLLCFTLPLVVWVLHIGWWEALTLDIGMTLFIVLYTLVFNWCYDYLRERVLARAANTSLD